MVFLGVLAKGMRHQPGSRHVTLGHLVRAAGFQQRTGTFAMPSLQLEARPQQQLKGPVLSRHAERGQALRERRMRPAFIGFVGLCRLGVRAAMAPRHHLKLQQISRRLGMLTHQPPEGRLARPFALPMLVLQQHQRPRQRRRPADLGRQGIGLELATAHLREAEARSGQARAR